ncbi:hypothetical protein ACKWTF_014906 [Chironomus riparius]
MNKVILSAFVLLLVAQGIESQFPIINFVGTLIVNLLSAPLAAITSSFVSTIAYNVLSFTGFSLTWQYSQSDFLIYVKPPAVVCSSTMSTSTIQLVSPTLKGLITTINTTVSGIDANVASFTSTLNNNAYSNCGRTLASLAVNLYDQTPRRLGYSMISIATVMGGRRPNQSPFGLTPYDPVYPVPSTILPRDTDSFRSQVGVQAKNFILYLPYLFKDLNDAAAAYQNLRSQVRGGCICPSSTTVSSLITQWTSLNTSIAGFTASTATTKTLIQVVGSAILTNVTGTFNATYSWMNSVLSCTQCLIGSLKNNGSRCVKTYCNDKPQNDSISAGLNDTACTASGLRAIGRFRNNLQLDYVLARNVELRAQSFLMSRVFRYVNDHSGCVGKGIVKIDSNTGLLRNSIFKKRMMTFKGHMDSFQLNIKNSYNALSLNINSSIATFNSYIDSTILSSTAVVSSTAVTFAETVINSSSLYPCCQQYAGQALDIQDKFQSDVKSCMQNTAAAVNNIAASMTTDLTSHGKHFNRFTSTVDSCINTYCKRWPCVNAFLLIPSFDKHVSNCVTAVNTGLTGYNPNVFTIGNASIASVAANIATANVTFNQCINVAVSNAQQSLLTVQNIFNTCKKVGTCTNGTTDMRPILGQAIDIISANLTALLSFKGNTSIDPECLSAVMADAAFLMNQTMALNSSLMSQSYETEEKVLNFISSSLAALSYNFSLCKSDNRTILLPRIDQAIVDLSNLWNLTMNITGLNPECLNMSQQNISGVMDMALSLQTQLSLTDYVVDFAAVDALPSIVEQLRAEFNDCMSAPYDNRTAFIPNITQIILDLQTMINITLNLTMDPSCAVPLLANLTSVLAIADTLPTMIFNFTYDVDFQIVAGAQNLTNELEGALAACQVYDNRTLLLPGINQVINDINNLLNLSASSTGDPACFASLIANMSAVLNVTLDLQVSLTDYSYDVGLSIIGELHLVMAEFQAAFNSCLNYDNRTALAADVSKILANATALGSLIANSTASSYCLGPLQQNISILANVSIMLQTDIYNFTYDIGLAIVTEMQSYLAQLQASYDACLLFDNRTLLHPEVIADSASLNAFAIILMSSTADPYCLGPIQQNLSVLLTMQGAIESGLFNSSYAASLAVMINFDVSFAQLQAAYNACLTFDNRTLLVPTINNIVSDLTALAATLANSTASSYCLLPLQANLTMLLNVSSTISTDVFNYSYEIGASIISGYQMALAQAQAAYTACLTFDNRTLLEMELNGDLANLTIFANILANSTADPYCLGAIQQNFSLLMSVATAMQSGLYNTTYSAGLASLIDMDAAFAQIQAAYAACLVFDNRTLLTPSCNAVLLDLTALNNLIANSTASSYCLGPLQTNLSVLMTASASLQIDMFNYSYDIAATIIAGFQLSIAEAQAAYNACLLFDNRTLQHQELQGDLSNLTILANLIMSSTAAPYCLTPIQNNLSVIQSISQAIQSGLFSSTYDENLEDMISLDAAVAQLQAAFDACLLFDNRTLLAADLPGIMSSINSISAQISSAVADPACLSAVQANLTLMLNISQSLQTDLFNYTYDIGLAIIGSLQMSITEAQTGLATCLADPRIPMLPVISGAAANASALSSLLANSTASSYCLLPLQQNVSLLLNISQSFQQDFYSYDFDIGSTILNSLQSSLAEAQAAYEACLLFDNRTLLEMELTGDMANLTALVNIIMSSTADPYCLTAIQQNASAILSIAQAIQAGLFGNSYLQGLMQMESLDASVAQLQAAYDACLLFDNRTLLVPIISGLQANFSALAALVANSTADQYCLGPLQYNLTMLLSMSNSLQVDIFNYSYEIANWIIVDLQLALALEQANYIDCLAFDNRTLLQPNVTATLNDLTALSNTIMSSTADPYCLTAIQQNISMMLSGAATFSSELFNNSYELDLNVLLSLQSAMIDIQAAYNACLVFDNRTLLVPSIAALQANLSALANLAGNSTADQYCLGPLQYNLTMLISMTSSLQVDIFNYSYEIANWIIADLEASLAMEQSAYAACLLFDNRTLLQSELAGDLSNLTAFYNLIMSSSADPYCLSAIQQNMTVLYNFAQALQSGLFNYSYDINLAVMAEIDATFADLQVAYTACLNFDNRTLLIPTVSSVLANLTALANIAINSTADPYCLGPIQHNLSILVGASTTLEVDIFNYTYDIAASIIADLQDSIAMEQAAYEACLTFDNRTLLQPEIRADSASLNAFANILMSSTADPYCLTPIQQNMSSLMTLAMAIESGLFNSSYSAALNLMINFDVEFANLQAAYNACLTFDNRTLLVPTIATCIADINNILALIPTSNGSLACMTELQQNLTLLLNMSTSLQVDIFNYTYEIGSAILLDLQLSISNAQAKFTTCQIYDPRTEFFAFSSAATANLSAIAANIVNISSTATCLAAVQQAMALLNNASASFHDSILVVTYNTSQANAASLAQAILDLQAAEAACRNFDNRTVFMGSNLVLASNVSDLMNIISSSSALSECVNPILQDAVWLMGNITAFNGTVLNSSYATDLATSNSLYATFSALQAQWSACLVYTTTTNSTTDPRTALNSTLASATATLNDLLGQIQNFTGNQTGVPGFTTAINDLLSQIQTLQANLMNNNFTTDAALVSSIQSAVAQQVADWAAYVANSTTTTVDPRVALTAEAQILLAELQDFLQTIQNYTGNQTGVPGFINDTTALIAQVQDLINNMMNNPASVDAATLANLDALATQKAAEWLAYVNSDVTTTTSTTIDPRLALLAQAQSLLANLSSLSQDMQAFTGDQTGVPTFLGLTGDLTTQVQNLINSIMSSDYATSAALLSNLENFAAQDSSAWTAYKDSNTASTAAATSTSDLTPIAQTLLSDLNALLANMLNYAGNQTGVPGFVSDTSNLISQLESLIAGFGTNGLSADIASLTALQNQVAQEATAWAAYVFGAVLEISSTTTTTTTEDPRLALLADAEGLLAVLGVLTQDMQNYTGNQAGVPTFLGLTADLTAQVQDLIANMMNNDYTTDAALLSNLQNLVSQDADAWAVYKASETAPTTAATSTADLTTIAQSLLDSTNILLQDMQNYTGNQTGVPGFVNDTTALIGQLQNLIANLGTDSLSTDIAALTALQNAAAQGSTAWAAYVAGSTLDTTTTIDPRIALTTEAQQLLAELQDFLQTIQNYTGNQTGFPGFINDTTALIAQVQDLINNMMNNPASVDAATLANLDTLATQKAAEWLAYVASDTTATTVQPATTTLAPTNTTQAQNETLNSTTTTVDPRLALLSTSQILAANLAALAQDMQTYTGNQAGVPTFSSLTSALTTQVQDLSNNMMNNDYATDAAQLSNLQLLSSQDAAAWIAYKSSDTATTAAATSTAALNTTVESTVNDLNMLLQTMQSYADNQAVVPTSVSDTISNIQNLIAASQNLSASLGTNGLAADIAAVTDLQNQVSQAATGWAAYIGNILNASTTTTVSTTTASIPTTIVSSNGTDTTSNSTTLAPPVTNSSDMTSVLSNDTTTTAVDSNATTTTQDPSNVTTTTIAVTLIPTTAIPTTAVPTTEVPTTEVPTTEAPTTLVPTTAVPTTEAPTTLVPTTAVPTTEVPTTEVPTTEAPTTLVPTTAVPTTEVPTTEAPTTLVSTTAVPTTEVPTTEIPTTLVPTTTTLPPTTLAPTTILTTTLPPTTLVPTTTTTKATTTTSKTYPLTTMAGQCDWCFKIPLLSWAQLLISFKSTNCGCPAGYVVMRNWTDLIFGKEHSCCY